MADSVNYHNVVGRKPYRPFSAYLPPDLAADPETLKSFNPLDEDIDLQWGGESVDRNKFNMYYDYYFSGEDVKIYIDGLFDAGYELDIASFSFSIRQEKSPLYGFWSYNFDAVMTGTRLIQRRVCYLHQISRKNERSFIRCCSDKSKILFRRSKISDTILLKKQFRKHRR
jgi:hypothetical protein